MDQGTVTGKLFESNPNQLLIPHLGRQKCRLFFLNSGLTTSPIAVPIFLQRKVPQGSASRLTLTNKSFL